MAERTQGAGGEERPPSGAARLLQPRYVFPALLLLVVATVLLTPVETARSGDPRLTTNSTESQGARGLYELAGRLGWDVARRTIPYSTRTVTARPGEPASRATVGDAPLDDSSVYAVLDPPNDLSAAEAGALLAAVRRGAGLLVVLRRGGALADSLRLRPSIGGAPQVKNEGPDSPDSCPPNSSRKGAIDWPGGRVFSYWLEPRAPLPPTAVAFATLETVRRQPRRAPRPQTIVGLDGASTSTSDSAAPAATGDSATTPVGTDPFDDDQGDEDDEPKFDPDTVAVASPVDDSAAIPVPVNSGARDAAGNRAAIVGFPLGAGRVVAVADPDWLRNDVLRVCRWNAGVQAARMLEYLAARPTVERRGRRRLEFDEYHQGFGRHPSAARLVRRALFGQPLGRTTAQVAIAALVLLAAAGARGIAPRSRARLTRRSPLEHVGALSRAYAQIGATRLATRRLVRGLRRRHGSWGTSLGGTPRSASRTGESDDLFLSAVADRFPALARDVALLRESATSPGTPERLLEVGRAANRIERALAAGRVEPVPSSEPLPAR